MSLSERRAEIGDKSPTHLPARYGIERGIRSPRFILGVSSKINFGLLKFSESKIYLGRLVQ
ncbi:MAG: hypothetical protein ABFS56_09610, partial [Pseudomonadota bacterium]